MEEGKEGGEGLNITARRALTLLILTLYGLMVLISTFMAIQGSKVALNFFLLLVGLPLGLIPLAMVYAIITSPPIKSVEEYQREYEELLRKVKKAILEEEGEEE